MAKYCFPAVITPEAEGYSVAFPDLENCFTCGETLYEACAMAEEALAMMLTDMEDHGEEIPAPMDAQKVEKQEGELVTLVAADTAAYRRKRSQRAVKKTLTIPEWLNEAAEERGVNFSQTLQEALVNKLNLA